jgi:hypothetical protein
MIKGPSHQSSSLYLSSDCRWRQIRSFKSINTFQIRKVFMSWRIFNATGIALSYGLDDWGFESRQRLRIFLFSTSSRPALGPTQPPIQWVRGVFSLGIKRLGREADRSLPSTDEVKEYVEFYFHSSNTLSWRGAQSKHIDHSYRKLSYRVYCKSLQLLVTTQGQSQNGMRLSGTQFLYLHTSINR